MNATAKTDYFLRTCWPIKVLRLIFVLVDYINGTNTCLNKNIPHFFRQVDNEKCKLKKSANNVNKKVGL